MKHIFSSAGKKRLEKIIQKGVLCAFDFDGTLAPIVSHPDNAVLPAAIGEKLAALTALTPVAILTGRSISDIASRLNFTPHYLIGNHGAEGIPGRESESRDYQNRCARWETDIQNALPGWKHNDPGLWIENKQYTLSIHYRQTTTPAEMEKDLPAFLRETAPDARIVAGKFLYSLVPADAPDKGNALSALISISGAPSALYIGDDITDETVFALKYRNLLAIHVEKDSASAAPWYIEKQEDITKLLDNLIDRIQLPLTIG